MRGAAGAFSDRREGADATRNLPPRKPPRRSLSRRAGLNTAACGGSRGVGTGLPWRHCARRSGWALAAGLRCRQRSPYGCGARGGVSFEREGNRVERMAFDIGLSRLRPLHRRNRPLPQRRTHGEFRSAWPAWRGDPAEPSPCAPVASPRSPPAAAPHLPGMPPRRDSSAASAARGGRHRRPPVADRRGVALPVQGAHRRLAALHQPGLHLRAGGQRAFLLPQVRRAGDAARGVFGVGFDLDGFLRLRARNNGASIAVLRARRPRRRRHARRGRLPTCARLADGTIVRCWGLTPAVSSARSPHRRTHVHARRPRAPLRHPGPPGGTPAPNTDGTVRCRGGNHFGQLGTGTVTDRPCPRRRRRRDERPHLAGPGTSCTVEGRRPALLGQSPGCRARPRRAHAPRRGRSVTGR